MHIHIFIYLFKEPDLRRVENVASRPMVSALRHGAARGIYMYVLYIYMYVYTHIHLFIQQARPNAGWKTSRHAQWFQHFDTGPQEVYVYR